MPTPLVLGDPQVVSVITASHRPYGPWLLEAYQSLRQQELEGGRGWEWCLQLDGAEELMELIPEALKADTRVHIQANGASLGAATTRNYALTRSSGAFVRNLDADDWLLKGALERSVSILAADPELAFVTTGALIQCEGCEPEPHPIIIPHQPGRLEAGAIDTYWRVGENRGLFATTVTFNRTHLLAYGGWAGLRRFEDGGLMFPMAAAHPIFYDPTPSIVYRLHEQQTIRNENEEHIRVANSSYTAQRIAAQRALNGVIDDAPTPRHRPSYAMRIAAARQHN